MLSFKRLLFQNYFQSGGNRQEEYQMFIKWVILTSKNIGLAHIAFLTCIMRIQDMKLSRHRSFQRGVSHVVDWKKKKKLKYFAAPPTKEVTWIFLALESGLYPWDVRQRDVNRGLKSAYTLLPLFGSFWNLTTLWRSLVQLARYCRHVTWSPLWLPTSFQMYVTPSGTSRPQRNLSGDYSHTRKSSWIQQKNFPAEPSPNCWPPEWWDNGWSLFEASKFWGVLYVAKAN